MDSFSPLLTPLRSLRLLDYVSPSPLIFLPGLSKDFYAFKQIFALMLPCSQGTCQHCLHLSTAPSYKSTLTLGTQFLVLSQFESSRFFFDQLL